MTKHVPSITGLAADAWARVRHGSRSVGPMVLMYHRIDDLETAIGPAEYAVAPDDLRDDLQWLATNATPIPLAEVAEWARTGRSLPGDAVAVTFDDGYRDIQDVVVPLLDEFQIPATVFIPTRLIEAHESPFAWRLLDAVQSSVAVTVDLDGLSLDRSLSTPADRRAVYTRIYKFGKRSSIDDREEILSQLDADREPVPMLRPVALSDLTEFELLTVGSHGHSHVPLDCLSRAAARDRPVTVTGPGGDLSSPRPDRLGSHSRAAVRDDLFTSKTRLERWTGTTPDQFAFPYGAIDHDAREAVADCFCCSVTTEQRRLRPRDRGDAHLLPRVDGSSSAIRECFSDP